MVSSNTNRPLCPTPHYCSHSSVCLLVTAAVPLLVYLRTRFQRGEEAAANVPEVVTALHSRVCHQRLPPGRWVNAISKENESNLVSARCCLWHDVIYMSHTCVCMLRCSLVSQPLPSVRLLLCNHNSSSAKGRWELAHETS